MNTSDFVRHGKHPKAVAITARNPNWYKGKYYKLLAPSLKLVQAYRSGKISEETYTDSYVETVLDKLDPQEVFDELGKDAILLCYEKPGEFCHRRIVARWFEIALGIKVEEME